jgi:hypothetical protein
MAINVPKTVAFTGGKIIETPNATGVADDITTLTGSLTDQAESTHTQFSLAPSVTDEIVNLGNMAVATLVMLNPDGAMSIKINGSSDEITLSAGPSTWFATISGLTASNPSGSATVKCELYVSSDVG